MVLMEVWLKISYYFIKISNFFIYNGIFLFFPFMMSYEIFSMTSRSLENKFFIFPKIAAIGSVCAVGHLAGVSQTV